VVATECGAGELLPPDCLVEVEPDSEAIADGIDAALAMEGTPSYEERSWSAVAEEYVTLYRELLG
jgi:hypothetical protein